MILEYFSKTDDFRYPLKRGQNGLILVILAKKGSFYPRQSKGISAI
jgi:hypothetical protein